MANGEAYSVVGGAASSGASSLDFVEVFFAEETSVKSFFVETPGLALTSLANCFETSFASFFNARGSGFALFLPFTALLVLNTF